ncbi:MAG: adenosylcobinamide-phosphate synthase CbiB [Paracoccaceae bacterium]
MLEAGAMALAMAIDGVLGWPGRLYARIGHPVTWLGRAIALADRRLNREGHSAALRRLAGCATLLAIVALAALPAWAVARVLPGGPLGLLLTAALAWPLIAARAMHDHVLAVAAPLSRGDLPAARQAVSMIVGRDPAALDEAGVARAALESLAENTSDGIVAPLFWGVLLGLPGIAAYKAVNTLDSMIGHRSPRHEAFGWASARFDDLVNLAPARLTGLIFALVSGAPGRALACMRADAARHRSPNAGWPEAAMAGALGIRLSGPRVYADRTAEEPWVNGAAPDPRPGDLQRGLSLYRRAMVALGAALALLAWVLA